MYRFRDDVVLEEICGAHILVALRPAWEEYPFAIHISGRSALIWKGIENRVPEKEIVEQLQKQYGLSEDKAKKEYQGFIDYCLKKKYFIPETPI